MSCSGQIGHLERRHGSIEPGKAGLHFHRQLPVRISGGAALHLYHIRCQQSLHSLPAHAAPAHRALSHIGKVAFAADGHGRKRECCHTAARLFGRGNGKGGGAMQFSTQLGAQFRTWRGGPGMERGKRHDLQSGQRGDKSRTQHGRSIGACHQGVCTKKAAAVSQGD